MCRRSATRARIGEWLVMATGLVRIREIEGLTAPFALRADGHKVHFYLPAGWTGPMRDCAVVGHLLYALIDSGALAADECIDIWATLLGRAVGPPCGGGVDGAAP